MSGATSPPASRKLRRSSAVDASTPMGSMTLPPNAIPEPEQSQQQLFQIPAITRTRSWDVSSLPVPLEDEEDDEKEEGEEGEREGREGEVAAGKGGQEGEGEGGKEGPAGIGRQDGPVQKASSPVAVSVSEHGVARTLSKLSSLSSNSSWMQEALKIVAVYPDNPSGPSPIIEALRDALDTMHPEPSLNAIPFSKFDFGRSEDLEAFYSADVVFCDLSERKTREPLFYQLGVRESLGRCESVVLMHGANVDALRQVRVFSPQYVAIAYTHAPNGALRVVNIDADLEDAKDACDELSEHLADVLDSMEVRTVTQRKKWFMHELRKAATLPEDQRFAELTKLQHNLEQDPSFITAEIILNLVLAYRDIQKYDSIIRLVSSLKDHPDVDLGKATATATPAGAEDEGSKKREVAQVAIRVQHANALNRRNGPGDRAAALDIILEVVKTDKYCVPDNVCMCGRIYKDMFIESTYQDKRALGEAIRWYRKAFQAQQSEFAGINLATLLVLNGEQFGTSKELMQIGMCMNTSLGRKGNLESLTDYWAVATVFEMSILAEEIPQSLKAAACMFRLRPPQWYVRSTMNNIAMILQHRPLPEASSPLTRIFQFWITLFTTVCDDSVKCTEGAGCPTEIPVLLLEKQHGEGTKFQPCTLVINKAYGPHVTLRNICDGPVKYTATGDELPKRVPYEWQFFRDQVRKISLHNEDNLVLYMYAETFDFQLYFPKPCFRQAFYTQMKELEAPQPALDQSSSHVEVERIVRYEWEVDEDGKRVRLGKGSFGSVYSAVDEDTKLMIAVKEVEIKNREDLQPLQDEIGMHKQWRHPHIVSYLGYEVDGPYFRVFMEQIPGGSLSHLLREMWGSLGNNENIMADYTRQILKGLDYLHDRHVVHRDIKGDNILVNQFDGKLKLSDFGTSRRLANLNPQAGTTAGTMQFMAPEVINSERGYGLPADIWSLGCTVIEMATGLPPFHDYTPVAAMFKVGRDRSHPEYPDSLSEQCIAFLDICFKPEPSDRFSAKELLQHVWIRGHAPQAPKHSVMRSFSVHDGPSIEALQTPTGRSGRRGSESNALAVLGGLDFGRQITSPAELALPHSPTLAFERSDSAHPFERTASSVSVSSDQDPMQKKLKQHRNMLTTMVAIFKDESGKICGEWMRSIRKADPSLVQRAAAAEHIPIKSLEAIHAEMTAMISMDEDKPHVPDALKEVILELDPVHHPEMLYGVSIYKDVVLGFIRNQRQNKIIKPHWMFDIDRRLVHVCKALKDMMMQHLDSAVAKRHATMQRRKSIAFLPKQSSLDARDDRNPLRRYHSTENPALSRTLSDAAPRNLSINSSSSEPPRSALKRTTSDAVTNPAHERLRRNHSAQLGPPSRHVSQDFPDAGAESNVLLELERENRVLMAQLIETSRELNRRLASNLADQRSQINGLPKKKAVTPPSSATASVVGAAPRTRVVDFKPKEDEQMVQFLREAGLDEEEVQAFVDQKFTYPVLIHHAEKDDLADVVPFVGTRVKLWARILEERKREPSPSASE